MTVKLEFKMAEFPEAVDPDVRVGQKIALTVTGFIYKLEGDLVDVSSLGAERPQVMVGEHIVAVVVEQIVRAPVTR